MPHAHATAKVNGTVVAETDEYEVVDGNIYFPPSALKKDNFTDTEKHTSCPYKGKASYYSITAGDKDLKDSAWYYPEPKKGYEHIKDYVAFYGSKVDVTVAH